MAFMKSHKKAKASEKSKAKTKSTSKAKKAAKPKKRARRRRIKWGGGDGRVPDEILNTPGPWCPGIVDLIIEDRKSR